MEMPELPLCKYGNNCYRKNPQHLREYRHPDKTSKPMEGNESLKRTKKPEDQGTGVSSKKSRYSDNPPSSSSSSSTDRTLDSNLHDNLSTERNSKEVSAGDKPSSTARGHTSSGSVELSPSSQVALSQKCTKYSYYMTSVRRGIDVSYNQGSALTLHNVINGTRAELKESCVFSYMYDIDWIMAQFKPEDRSKPMTLVEGLKGDSRLELLDQRSSYSNIKVVQAKLDIMYGVHHTKMLILRYDTGIRIMITTANLIPLDWFQKSQALWCSPLCPPGNGDSVTGFRADLVEYLSAYRSKFLDEWVNVIKRHDMSKCRVFLIASVPGRHIGDKKSSFGHLKLRKVLRQHGPSAETSGWPVIGQFSSIGKLGTNAANWLTGELLTSLATTKGSIVAGRKPEIKLVFPTVEDVRTSLEGYQAGGSLPFNQQNYDQQRYIKLLMHKWRSDCRGRSSASPHIKSYLRLSTDAKRIPWFLMTSSNLSKAAWGMLEKQESQLMIRSYELGVLFIPQMYDLDTFICDPTFLNEKAFPVPFDLPLTPYDPTDEPWIVNQKYTDKPDSVGEYWNPYV